ncbi:hypothetical protein BH11MYX4_BH11MYX4_59720 [soil metagenome]
MNRTAYVFFVIAGAAALTVSACSSGDIAVGSSTQALQKKKDGTPTGNGSTCSWDTPTSSDAKNVGDNFKAPDGCNDCTCTAQGIACTLRDCAPACTEEAKQCPDGSYVARTGPKCEFSACPEPVACSTEAKLCPDGSAVGRSGPKCEFAPCPGGQACSLDGPNTCPSGTTCTVPSGLPTRSGTCQ